MAPQLANPGCKYGAIRDGLKDLPQTPIDDSRPHAPPSTWASGRGKWLWVAVFAGLAMGAVMPSMGNKAQPVLQDTAEAKVQQPPRSSSAGLAVKPAIVSTPLEDPAGATTALSFTAVNFYHLRDGKPALDYPWLKDTTLIEPHRETTLRVTNPREGYHYRWEIHQGSADGDMQAEAHGLEAAVILTKLDEHVVKLEELDADGLVVRNLEEFVMVKYVRREIRTLTDSEREELLDAMNVLWTARVDGGDGKELYGEDFADIYAINRLHFKAASPLECDHFHDGLGFLTNHALLTNTFEYSLQRVNPKLTVPYWDFTIEGSSSGGVRGEPSFEPQDHSPLFDPSWFGTYDTVDNMVKDGRWAYTPIPEMRPNNPGAVEADVYSKLRAPWNVNDRAYLTRGMGKMCGVESSVLYPWPTCGSHYDLLNSYDDFYSWVWQSLYDPHGPVHIWIGGVLDCEKTYGRIAELVGKAAATELAYYAFIHRKNMFREEVFSCEGTASIDQKPDDVVSSGMCGCLGYDLTQGDDYETIFNNMVLMDEVIGDADADTKRQVVAAMCSTTINDGDHLQASSSLDPSFWATHPTMDRLWQFSVLTGQITDFSWPDADLTYTKTDGTTVSETLSLYDETCVGHRGSDVFPFGLLDTDDDEFTIKTGVRENLTTGNKLSNREVLQALDPRSSSMSYVYDTFKWMHCTDEGFDFDDAWGEKKTSSTKRERPSFEKGVPRAPMYGSIKKRLEESKAAKQSRDAKR